MTIAQLTEYFQDAYPEIDEPTEEDWDNHTLAGLEEIDRDRFAATPECENSK